MLPPFDDIGYLPKGIHVCEPDELVARFGSGSPEREVEIDELLKFVEVAKTAGVRRILVNGSFVTGILGCANPFWHESENWVVWVISFKEECPMAHAMISVQTAFESLVVEQALAFAKEMESTANGAADGKVLDLCESLVLSKGRDLLRAILTGAAQQQADAVEKKGRRPVPVNAASPAGTRAAHREPS